MFVYFPRCIRGQKYGFSSFIMVCNVSFGRFLPFLVAFGCIYVSVFLANAQSVSPKQTLVIDPGHGGKDPGAVSKIVPGLYEKDVVLDIALQLRDSLAVHLPDLRVLLTRSTDTFIPLNERAELAQKANAALFLSIHANADESGLGMGSETFIMGINAENEKNAAVIFENRAITVEQNFEEIYSVFQADSPERIMLYESFSSAFREQSFACAEVIETAFLQRSGRPSRGVKQAFFIVLCQAGCPAVLTEVGFLSHPADAQWLATAAGRSKVAGALAQALLLYFRPTIK